jgi:iron complex outermembrane receptor protein
VACATATAIACPPAEAAPARRPFAIPAQAAPEALIAFAIQADISIGGVSACAGRSRGLKGTFTIREGLERLTAGACGFEIVDARTVRIVARAVPPPTPVQAPRPAPRLPAQPMIGLVSEVLVTATKRVEAANRIPASVSVVGADELDATGSIDASGATRQIAGVTMTNLGAGRDKILLRGLSDGAFTGRTRSTVGTFLDDAPITYNAPDPDLRLADVEAVEVVRGPQGALYGAGSLSGVYRIVTRKPKLGEFEGRVSVLGAWTESGSPSRQVEGVLNLPIVGDKIAARLVAYHEVQGGYLDDLNLRLTNVDRTNRDGGRLAIKAQFSDDWTATLSAAIQRLDSNDTQYVTNSKNLTRTNRVRENHDNNFLETALTVEGVGTWGRLQSSTAYVRHDFTSQYDASAALSLFGDSEADFGVYEEGAQVEMFSQDLVLTSVDSGALRWLVGAYGSFSVEKTPSTLDARATGGTAPRRVYTENRTDRRAGVALYGKASYDLTPGWTASAGARVFNIDLRTSSDVVVLNPAQSRAFVKKDQFQGWSPELSLQYEFADGDLVYLLGSEGYRPGGFNSGGLTRPSPSRSAFQPDRLRNYEAGAKLRLLDRKLDLRTAVFYDIWNDIQTDQYLSPSGLAYTANVGDGRNLGLEIEASWQPNPRWTLQANALFDSPKVTRVNPAFATRVQDRLPGVPDISFGSLTAYQRPLTDELSLLFTVEAGYVGRSRLTFDPALSPVMGGYFTGKLSAQIKTPRWRLAAFLENPTNSQGDTFAYGNPFTFGQVRQVTPQRPRTLSLALTAAF